METDKGLLHSSFPILTFCSVPMSPTHWSAAPYFPLPNNGFSSSSSGFALPSSLNVKTSTFLYSLSSTDSQIVLQQALFAPKLTFPPSSSSSSLRNFALISRVPSTPISWRCTPLIAKSSFLVRADSNLEGGGEATEDVPSDNVDDVSEGEAELLSDSEAPKLPRKARVKLGDVMGVIRVVLN